MNAILFVATLLVAGAYAQEHHHHKDIQHTLIQRGEMLVKATRHILNEHHLNGRGHLVEAVEKHVVAVEALVAQLKKEHADPKHIPELHHLHTSEEELLHLENRVAEELSILEHIIHNHHHNGDGKKQLLERAAALVEKANQAVEHHKSNNHKEIQEIKHEITVVEKLARSLELTKDGDDLKKEEAALARHEKTLAQLIERLNQRHHHNQHQ